MKMYPKLKFKLVVLFLLGTYGAFASVLEEKKQVIEKSYDITEKTVFEASNQFGDVHVNTWDQKKLKVVVEIIANGKSEERAQKMLDKISIQIVTKGTLISFVTAMDGNMNAKGDESFRIDYTVNLPANNKVAVTNKFGDIYLGTRTGDVNLDLSYGSLKTEDIEGFLELELSFGKGVLGNTGKSHIEVKYSELDMGNANSIEMEQQFSDVEIGDVDELEIESKYGSVMLGTVGVVDSDVQFSGFKIARLLNSLYMEANYVSEFEIKSLSKDFTKVSFFGKFSTINIRLEEGLKADLEAEFSFSNMNSSISNMETYYKVKEDHRSEYKARIGGGDPNKKIIVKSSYGDLRLR
ncbi:MAG: hypothetical protein RIC30_01090 [Marinoscillum sp.]|uniref:hypothetical protein n=1 Tax=Marinoscillum sp. TaxID=2024838 RepID=UPI0032FAF22D